ncbi:hypothetical protein [Streptomyces luteogriseus]|uniref:hypothetical protein n=1 Tax=Streptomyces luteogriseus TaxID=68233 RepID=UPI00380D24FF
MSLVEPCRRGPAHGPRPPHRTPGVRVLMRHPVLLGGLLYEHVEPHLRPGRAVTARHPGTPLSEPLLLERRDHP